MQEYWVNVYELSPHSTGYGSELSKDVSDYMIKEGNNKVLYRIHVKMKPITNANLWVRHSNILEKWLDL